MPNDPALRDAIRLRLRDFDRERFGERLWRRDPTLWKSDPDHQRIIADALGWLDVAEGMQTKAGDLAGFAGEVASEGFTHAVLLGMGGSSLAPEVLRATFGVRDGYPDLVICDSTDPQAVRSIQAGLDLEKTLFIVSSKSGGTTETASFHAYFYDAVRRAAGDRAGRQFIAITDPGTSLHDDALAQNFRAVFLNPPDIGGRYSALSYFGLVPAALTGLDVAALLDRARQVAGQCGPGVPPHENPAVKLGAALGELARGGRDKVTFALSPSLASLGAWLEQLLAESTGKEGVGLVPVDGESLGAPEVYGDDRVFVYLHLSGEHDARQKEALHAIADGHPTMTIDVGELLDLGGEFLRWEIATAAAGAVLGIDPFDQPNVQESKDNTKRLLNAFVAEGRLPASDGDASVFIGDQGLEQAVQRLLDSLGAGDYFALQAYLPRTEQAHRILQGIRMLVRDRRRVATALGYGPRFLHSTGQLHKGGAANGVFLQLTCGDPGGDLEIPDAPYTFGVLKRAQALGDLEALRSRDRRVLHVDLGKDPLPGLTALGGTMAQLLR